MVAEVVVVLPVPETQLSSHFVAVIPVSEAMDAFASIADNCLSVAVVEEVETEKAEVEEGVVVPVGHVVVVAAAAE